MENKNLFNENEKDLLKNFYQSGMKEQAELHPEDKNKIEDMLNKKNKDNTEQQQKQNQSKSSKKETEPIYKKEKKINEWENNKSYKKDGIEIIGNKWGLKPVPKEYKIEENNNFNNEIGLNFKKEKNEEDLMDVMKKKNEDRDNKLFSEFMEFANENHLTKKEDDDDDKKNVKKNENVNKNNDNNNSNNKKNENEDGNKEKSFADRIKMFSK